MESPLERSSSGFGLFGVLLVVRRIKPEPAVVHCQAILSDLVPALPTSGSRALFAASVEIAAESPELTPVVLPEYVGFWKTAIASVP